MDPILEIAASAALPVVEDASQGTGASYKGRRVGGFGRVGCFSLYANKIVTSAEGGMIVTSDEDLALRMRAIRNFGQMPGQHFHHAFLGGNYKMTDLCAAIGRAQIAKIDRYVAARRRQVDELNAALAGLDGLIERRQAERAWASAAPFGFHMLFRTAGLRQRAESALHAAGIETRPFFSLITAEEPYRSMGYAPDDTPVAADLVARGLYVSASPDLTADDRTHIADTLRAVARAEGLG
jgi:perosamine synthetase